MRTGLVFALCLLLLVFAAPAPLDCQFRTPDTGTTQPGGWPKQGGKRTVDITQLKSDAQELNRLTHALPEQIDRVGSVLPTGLIANLKKIEKLSKHIRSAIE